MANQEHLDILKQGVEAWNKWREDNPKIRPDLTRAELAKVDLGRPKGQGINLNRANLTKANLTGAKLAWANFKRANLSSADLAVTLLNGADFSGANLKRADLAASEIIGTNFFEANLRQASLSDSMLISTSFVLADLSEANFASSILMGADFSGADLSGAHLYGANLNKACFNDAILDGANLSEASLVGTDLTGTVLTNCRIYGISAWKLQLKDAIQSNLIITEEDEPTITIDNLEVAQFIYLLLNNAKIRDVIDTIAKKAVLILGRFTPERKAVLDVLKKTLRVHGYLSILFDFDKPASRDITETISTLAHLARFVIADITEPKSIPQELSHIVPFLPSVPIVPLLHVSEREYGMYEHFVSYPWILPIYRYHDLDELLQSIQEQVIEPAEKKVKELAKR